MNSKWNISCLESLLTSFVVTSHCEIFTLFAAWRLRDYRIYFLYFFLVFNNSKSIKCAMRNEKFIKFINIKLNQKVNFSCNLSWKPKFPHASFQTRRENIIFVQFLRHLTVILLCFLINFLNVTLFNFCLLLFIRFHWFGLWVHKKIF